MMRNTPDDEETTDWRAVCEKTARAVRRAGRVKTLSDPYNREPQRKSRLKAELRTNPLDSVIVRSGLNRPSCVVEARWPAPKLVRRASAPELQAEHVQHRCR